MQKAVRTVQAVPLPPVLTIILLCPGLAAVPPAVAFSAAYGLANFPRAACNGAGEVPHLPDHVLLWCVP